MARRKPCYCKSRIDRDEHEREVREVIAEAVEVATAANLTKPYDLALCVQAALKEAGFRVE